MKFFVDSADIAEIKACVDMGLCDGVTTNPSIIAKPYSATLQTSP